MHDPMTVAFYIRYPWTDDLYPGHRPAFATIWHVDPETDGTDDSCDWRGGSLTKAEVAQLEKFARMEHKFFFGYELVALQGADPFSVILASWRSVKWELYRDRSLPNRELISLIDLATSPGDNLRCYARRAEADPEEFAHLLMLLARQIKRLRRPWYRHPKFHVHHLKVQIHPWQRLRRFLFDRCSYCGGRFRKGAPHASGDKLYHGRCIDQMQLSQLNRIRQTELLNKLHDPD
jgi:hypothetical protein